MNTLTTLIKTISDQLTPRYNDPILRNQYAWWMLQAITKKNKAELITHNNIELSAQQEQKLNEWIKRQAIQQEPLQYLLGSVPFGDLEILVEPPTLIPRPETEEWCLDLIEQLQQAKLPNLTILDMCTGSGCIALALARALPDALVYAVDISQQALQLARKNAQHNTIKNITFIESDLFTAIAPSLQFDVIVSNPPYIAQAEWEVLDESVKTWEDKKALVADNQGLEIIATIINNAHSYLTNNTQLTDNNIAHVTIEIGYKQGNAVANLMKNANLTNVQIEKDLEGKDRIVTGNMYKE